MQHTQAGWTAPLREPDDTLDRMRDAEEWVRRLQAFDEDAWRDYIKAFGRFVPIVSMRLGLTAEDRAEALQDMTVTALRSIHNLRDPERLASWTYTIARRAALNVRRERRRAEPIEPDRRLEWIPSPNPPVDEIRACLEDERHVRRALRELSDACRGLITRLFLVEPRPSYRELSREMRMPMGSIGPTLARCLEKLRRALESVSERPLRPPALSEGAEEGDRFQT